MAGIAKRPQTDEVLPGEMLKCIGHATGTKLAYPVDADSHQIWGRKSLQKGFVHLWVVAVCFNRIGKEQRTGGAKPVMPATADLGSGTQELTKEVLIEQIIHHRCMRRLPDVFHGDIAIRAEQRMDEGRRCPDRVR
jgi:hypothetical protein